MSLSKLMLGFLAIAVGIGSSQISWAQPGGGGGGRGGFMGGFAANSAMLLMNPKVREELELVDDQVAEIEELQTKMREEAMSLFQRGGGGGGGNFEDARAKMEQMSKDFEADINEILLPNQRTRLKQLANQMRVRGRNGAGGGLLENEEIKKELDITPEQEEKLKEEADKAAEFIRTETAKIQKKAMEKVLGVLDEGQRKKYREMVGDDFDFGNPMQQFGQGMRGNGGNNNRGGGRGGRGPDF